MKTFQEFGIEIPYNRTTGNVKTFCPKCHEQRRDKRDKSLSVNLEKGIWHCHYCEWTGTLHVGERSHTFPKKEYRRPTLRPVLPANPKIVEWFKSRGISQPTVEKMRIFEGERLMPQTGKKRANHTVQLLFKGRADQREVSHL